MGWKIHRRQFLSLGAVTVAAVGLAACTPRPTSAFVAANGTAVDGVDAARRMSGDTVARALTAEPVTLDLAGQSAPTWAYRGASAAEPIRGKVGDLLTVTLQNDLPDPTSVHWHGLALRNNMDGVPSLTQKAVAAGEKFTYEFVLPHSGTHWFHPHVGSQLDRALYAPLIVDDPSERGDYDQEWIIVLDDWLDGITTTPDKVFEELSGGMGEMGGMDQDGAMRMGNTLMGAESDVLGGDAGDVYYPLYLLNGRPPADPESFTAKPGERVRLRIINAGADTAFRFGITNHRLTITHSDGFAVEPFAAESVVLGMGERYDALVTAGDGVFAMIAEALGKQDSAMAILRTGSGTVPPVGTTLPQTRKPAMAADLVAAASVSLPTKPINRTLTVELTGDMASYGWGINGKRFDIEDPLREALAISRGERVLVEFKNSTRMWHPMHLHGHTYQHPNGGPRKDTSIVLPGQTLQVQFDADNPGRWLTHCHNLYHGEAGMMTTIAYLA